jgi:hypothetical protein
VLPFSESGKSQWNSLRQGVITATRGRFHYLPEFWEIQDLVIDLEDARSVSTQQVNLFQPIASLVSPFAGALLQHSRFRGRTSVPDLDVDMIKRRLMAA